MNTTEPGYVVSPDALTKDTKGERAAADERWAHHRIELPADPGLVVIAYTAEPRSKSAEALSLLASWAVTDDAGVGKASAHDGSPNRG